MVSARDCGVIYGFYKLIKLAVASSSQQDNFCTGILQNKVWVSRKKGKKAPSLERISNQAGRPNMGHGLLLSLRDGAYLLYASPSSPYCMLFPENTNNMKSESVISKVKLENKSESETLSKTYLLYASPSTTIVCSITIKKWKWKKKSESEFEQNLSIIRLTIHNHCMLSLYLKNTNNKKSESGRKKVRVKLQANSIYYTAHYPPPLYAQFIVITI